MFKAFLLGLFVYTLSLLSGQVNAQSVYTDYRSNYTTLPAYNRTVQWIVEPKEAAQTLYFRQNLGFSEDETAFLIPFKGERAQIKVEDNNVWKDILEKTNLPSYFAEKTADFTVSPTLYTKANKDDLFKVIEDRDYDVGAVHQKQINNWFNEGLTLLFFSLRPVSEPRVTWTQPLKIELTNAKVEIPMVWLRPEYSKITTGKNKVIDAEDFEGGNGGWLDEFQGEGANSLVTRDNTQQYEGSFALKVMNKPGSINAVTTQTFGPLVPGEHYIFSAYVRNGTITSGTASLRVMGDGLVQFTDGVPMYNGLGHEWQRISMTFQAKSAYHFLSLMAGGESGQYVFWDNVQLEKGTTVSDFQKDKVGVNNSSIVKEDLVTSSVDLDVMIFGDNTYASANPLLHKAFYKLEKKPTFVSGSILSSARGTIDPVDTAAFMQFDESNDEIVSLPLPPVGLETGKHADSFLLVGIIILASLIAAKHIFALVFRIEGQKDVALIFEILYFAGWLVNTISMIFLSVYLYGQFVQRGLYNILDSTSVFFAAAFIMSMAIYLVTFIFFLRYNGQLIKRMSQIQIGVTVVLLLVAVSIVISDMFRMFSQRPNVPNPSTFFSNIPQLLLLVIELAILIRLYTKVKSLGTEVKG